MLLIMDYAPICKQVLSDAIIAIKAFESSDYNKIEQALASSTTFADQISKQKEQIRQELLIVNSI